MQYSIVKCILCTTAIAAAAAALLALLQYEPSLLLGNQPESDHINSNSAQNNVPSVTSNNNNEEKNKNKNGSSSTSIKQHEHDRSLSWVTNYFGTNENTYPSLSNELSAEELSEQSERDIEYKSLRTHDKSTTSGKSSSTATGKSRKAKRFSPTKELRQKNRLLSWVSIFFDTYFSWSTPEVRKAHKFYLVEHNSASYCEFSVLTSNICVFFFPCIMQPTTPDPTTSPPTLKPHYTQSRVKCTMLTLDYVYSIETF